MKRIFRIVLGVLVIAVLFFVNHLKWRMIYGDNRAIFLLVLIGILIYGLRRLFKNSDWFS